MSQYLIQMSILNLVLFSFNTEHCQVSNYMHKYLGYIVIYITISRVASTFNHRVQNQSLMELFKQLIWRCLKNHVIMCLLFSQHTFSGTPLTIHHKPYQLLYARNFYLEEFIKNQQTFQLSVQWALPSVNVTWVAVSEYGGT